MFFLVPVFLQVFRGHEMEPNGNSNVRLFESRVLFTFHESDIAHDRKDHPKK